MPYTINKYNGEQISVVADGTIDNTTDLKLIGKNYAGYGEVQNENFLFLLENFANTSPPPRPIAGQIWFDLSNRKLKFYDKANLKWRTTGGSEVGTVEPTGLTKGDFWWDELNKQLYAYNGSTYTLVGPQGVAGSQTTQLKSISVRDTSGNNHAIVQALVDGDTIFTISADDVFTLDDTTNPFTGFTKIRQGITLAYTNNDSQLGQTTSSHRFWGTATNADRLGGYPVGDFIRSTSAIFTQPVNFSDAGFTVGGIPKLRVFNSDNTTPTIQNLLNDTIVFQTTSGGSTRTPLKLVGSNVLPGADNATDLGETATKFKTIYAYTFSGTATQAGSLQVGTEYKTASVPASNGTIVARTSVVETINGTTIPVGSIKGEYFVGTATSANYADLAEKYLADADYEVGTVVAVGGEREVTACSVGQRAFGAVSEKPAYLMNVELAEGTPIALKGRVPVKVSGVVIKGQRLVAGSNGTAQAAMGNNADTFAIALESSDDIGVKLVECIIL